VVVVVVYVLFLVRLGLVAPEVAAQELLVCRLLALLIWAVVVVERAQTVFPATAGTVVPALSSFGTRFRRQYGALRTSY
jgi:hypothetical protein